jgi:hypothetical protein
MAYLHDGNDFAAFGGFGCGSRCACASCRQGSPKLGEYYYEGEGRDDPRERGRGTGLSEAPVPSVRNLQIVAKSFIAPIGWNTGSPYCGGFANPSADVKLRALAFATDAAFSEDPRTDAKDKHYRLYSSRTFTVSCAGGNIVSVIPTPIDTDSGRECIPRTSTCLQPPPLVVSGVTARLVSPTAFEFAWTAKGRPHLGAEPAFQAVCPRTSVFIWHTVEGRIECASGEPRVAVRLAGSRFPSHRVFVNGVLLPPAIAQGPFKSLWVPAGFSDPTRVA